MGWKNVYKRRSRLTGRRRPADAVWLIEERERRWANREVREMAEQYLRQQARDKGRGEVLAPVGKTMAPAEKTAPRMVTAAAPSARRGVLAILLRIGEFIARLYAGRRAEPARG